MQGQCVGCSEPSSSPSRCNADPFGRVRRGRMEPPSGQQGRRAGQASARGPLGRRRAPGKELVALAARGAVASRDVSGRTRSSRENRCDRRSNCPLHDLGLRPRRLAGRTARHVRRDAGAACRRLLEARLRGGGTGCARPGSRRRRPWAASRDSISGPMTASIQGGSGRVPGGLRVLRDALRTRARSKPFHGWDPA